VELAQTPGVEKPVLLASLSVEAGSAAGERTASPSAGEPPIVCSSLTGRALESYAEISNTRASVKKASSTLKLSLKRLGTSQDVQIVDHGAAAPIVRDSCAAGGRLAPASAPPEPGSAPQPPLRAVWPVPLGSAAVGPTRCAKLPRQGCSHARPFELVGPWAFKGH
jgi:hypothetical protein